ncbi:dihydrodipicolinate synthase family protein [Pseudomonas sp. OHS18]|uniref:dihydrodipicolinate synthase family protein n=1 Tax=Pseudomonas sp. OHS18 TaxID=3399679 RepID=UPI003A889EEA
MIRGSIAAIVTPTNAAGEVDERRLARLIDLHLHAGSDALLLPGPRVTAPLSTSMPTAA